MSCPIRILFHEPRIPSNTGSTIRLSAITGGAELHLAGPLGFSLEDAKLRRAGLDYHDLATLHVHEDLAAAYAACARSGCTPSPPTPPCATPTWRTPPPATCCCSAPPNPPDWPPRCSPTRSSPSRCGSRCCRGNRSLNLATATGIAVYEAWRQFGFPPGAQ